MAFNFNWPRFSDQFHASAREMLESALNKGSKPPIIADKIEVVELEMGTQPPELEVRDIGEVTMDQFRGIFRLSYSGDAYIVLRTKVQANPLIHKKREGHLLDEGRGMVAAQAPLVVPMNLRLSNFKLNSYVVLVVSKQKGITLVFKTDPLQNVDVNSTFDRIGVIQKYIQKEIEGQLREMFREDLPSIIHKLSQRWFSRELSAVARVEVPYARKFAHQPTEDTDFESVSQQGEQTYYAPPQPQPAPPPSAYTPPSVQQPFSQARSTTSRSYSHASSSHSPRSVISTSSNPARASSSSSTFPEIENYDPTYGLRPEELPAKGDYSGFAKLWQGSSGLGELAEEPEALDGVPAELAEADELWEQSEAAGPSTWQTDAPASEYWDESVVEPAVDYETIYAVGGGTVTRPRVLHSQSLIGTPSDTATVRSTQGTVRAVPSRSMSIHGVPTVPMLRFSRTNSMPLGLRIHTPPSAASTPVAMAVGPRSSPLSLGPAGYFHGWESEDPTMVQSPPMSARSSFSVGESAYSLPHRTYTPSLLGTTQAMARTRSMPASRRHSPPSTTPSTMQSQRPPLSAQPVAQSSARPSRSSSGLTYSGSTPPSSEVPPTEEDEPASPSSAKAFARARSGSITQRLSHAHLSPFDQLGVGSPPRSEYGSERGIVLKPAVNARVNQLAMLTNSHQTLSPYTRSMQHYAVRSAVPKAAISGIGGAPPERAPIKARRKRTYHIGKKTPVTPPEPTPSSPRPASDYSEYFHVSPQIEEAPILESDDGLHHRAPYVAA
ncbi:hypothetical protein CALCODRAFT_480925 [Calocera cornea HHB12733]|uniref:Mitochondrial distribution and morphology protein 34 n=1 Tax=Calocera cornea HHB12733 TaxID=1353952 RepID=A0A165I6V0_9BASI|nr:hypothetical protein CALCODRAFT_480925 [Calocera cornea HHB12733]